MAAYIQTTLNAARRRRVTTQLLTGLSVLHQLSRFKAASV